MKKNRIISMLSAILLVFSSCEGWLTQKDWNAISTEDIYSSEQGINSIVANLYSRLRYEQDFQTDGESYDMCRWDEATNYSQYWSSAGNVNRDYRSYYDYTFIREINLHIEELKKNASNLSEDLFNYYLAEARFIRAMAYFTLVSRMGGVPIITETMNYVDNPASLARKRDKESDVYDFIIRELDEIKNDLDVRPQGGTITKSRATKGSALALKSRAALYAGSIAYNHDRSETKGLNLPSGATGIPAEMAEQYLQQCLDAMFELDNMNYYSLYKGDANLSDNYYKAFTNNTADNKEIIFYKAYDGINVLNRFTQRALPRSMTSIDKSGAQINPVLNLVNAYELTETHEAKPLEAYNGQQTVETIDETTSTLDYKIFDKPEDIFAGRDPRLAGTILYPGSTFRGNELDLQAGLAILETDGSYTFKVASSIANIATTFHGEGEEKMKVTGEDGPFRVLEGNWYISHTGFLLRKFVDSTNGSETQGESTVPYVVFRYGEMLLNAAEAAFLLNQNGITAYEGQNTKTLALDYINKIRERAGGENFKLADNELTFDRIINERRVELAFEDHRYNDLKRWRTADEIWNGDREDANAILFGLWPYKIYAPGNEIHGKWLYRIVKIENRGSNTDKGTPIKFDLGMYYATYPINEGNTLVEPNPHH